MEQPPNAPFNLDSFIRQRAEEQRQQTKQEKRSTSTTPPPSKPEKRTPPPLSATVDNDRETESSYTEPKTTSDGNHSAINETREKGKLGRETADVLIQSTRSARQSKEAAQKAAAELENDAEDSQARLAAEAAQEAAQASLEAIEFAHQAARSAIEEASAGREQKRTYNTHRLLVLLNITLLVAALISFYLFIWPGINLEQKTAVTPTDAGDKTAEHLTQQLLLDSQRERLRSEQELTLMERSLAKLVEEQQALKKHLNETKDLLNSERERMQQKQKVDATFQKMEQDLKRRIADLEKRLEQQEQPPVVAPSPVTPRVEAVQQAVPKPATAPPTQPALLTDEREKEVDQILQKLYSLHSELSEQKESTDRTVAQPEPLPSDNRPYSYNRR